MKRLILIVLGLVPLLVFGFSLNHLIMSVFFDVIPPFMLIGVTVLVVWFGFGLVSVKLEGSRKAAIVLLNAPAFVILILILLQELVFRSFWLNIVGFGTQMFYLPLIGLGSGLSAVLPGITTFSLICSIAFVLLLLSSFLGRTSAERMKR